MTMPADEPRAAHVVVVVAAAPPADPAAAATAAVHQPPPSQPPPPATSAAEQIASAAPQRWPPHPPWPTSGNRQRTRPNFRTFRADCSRYALRLLPDSLQLRWRRCIQATEGCTVSHCISNHPSTPSRRHHRREHGLQLPLHPLQLTGWLVLTFLATLSFIVLIPALHATIQPAARGTLTVLLAIHVILHLAAALIDPADRALLQQRRSARRRIVPEFDRAKHRHVIEDGRCHLCNIRTTDARTKHCSLCNKCVGRFDHHCKWLNHCVGRRNYMAFVMCVLSAIVAATVVTAAVVTELVWYGVRSEWLGGLWGSSDQAAGADQGLMGNGALNGDEVLAATTSATTTATEMLMAFNESSVQAIVNATETLLLKTVSTVAPLLTQNATDVADASTVLPSSAASESIINGGQHPAASAADLVAIGMSNTGFLICISVLGILAAVSVGLLLHLCVFHVYLSFVGLTTYEYIRRQRDAAANVLQTAGPGVAAAQGQTIEGAAAGHRNQCTNSNPSGGGDAATSSSSSSSSSAVTQLYCCSKVSKVLESSSGAHSADGGSPVGGRSSRPKTLHCCGGFGGQALVSDGGSGSVLNSSEQQQHHKAIYICSVVSENSRREAQLTSTTTTTTTTRYHCCARFKHGDKQSIAGAASAMTVATGPGAPSPTSAGGGGGGGSYLKWSKRCMTCNFKMKSPKSGEPRSILSAGGGGADKRCCLKTTKHHRWKRKWNCCSAVPDSPDVSEDVIRTISDSIASSTAAATSVDVVQTMSLHESPAPMLEVPDELYQQQQRELRQQQQQVLLVKQQLQQQRPPRLNGMVRTCSTEKKLDCATIATFRYPTSATETPTLSRPFNSSVPNHQANEYAASLPPPQPPSSPQKNSEQRPRMMRPWAVMRFRHVLRMFGRYRGRSECRGRSGSVAGPSRHSDDSASSRHNQVRPTGEAAAGAGEPSTWSTYGSSSSSSDSGDAADAVQTIPLSGHRNRLPVLPPPSRRKIRNPTDLQELSNSLAFVQTSSTSSSSSVSCSSSRFLPSGSVRRLRRKNAMRQLSPTLSPIQESGLSNPTSPQPFRHAGSLVGADGATLVVDGKVICVNDA